MSNVSTGTYNYELNSLESFCVLFKYLWVPPDYLEKQSGTRAKLAIVDTLMMKEGVPYLWIFTSDKTGEVMKKRTERLSSDKLIVEAFASRSKALKGQKESTVRTKIAVVWYIQSSRAISSYLVDETELYSILRNKLTEIVAIQVFMGGYSYNGNGIFEHTMWLDRKAASVKGRSFEFIGELESGFVNTVFTNNSPKLEISEKRHESLKNLVSRLNRHLETLLDCRIAQITIQAVFNSAAVPHIVCCKSLSICNAPNDFMNDREKFIYLSGVEPKLPPFSEKSLLLPMKLNDYSSSVTGGTANGSVAVTIEKPPTIRQSVDRGRRSMETTPFLRKSGSSDSPVPSASDAQPFDDFGVDVFQDESEHNKEADMEAIIRSVTELSSSFATSSASLAKPIRYSKSRKAKNRASIVGRSRSPIPSIVHVSKSDPIDLPENLNDLFIPEVADGKGPSRINYENREMISAILGASQTNNNNVIKEEQRNQRLKGKTSVLHANLTTIHAISKGELDLIVEQSVGKCLPSTKHIDQTLSASRSKDAIYQKRKTYLSCTENSAGKSLQNSMVQALRDKLMLAQKGNQSARVRPESAPAVASATHEGDEQNAKTGKESGVAQPSKGQGLRKVLPLSGAKCFGDHCDFADKIRNGQNGVESSQKAKSRNCTHHIAYKSILLARADARFLGFKIDDNLSETIWEKFRTVESEFEKIYTYFVKWYISCVANKSEEEAKKVSYGSNNAPFTTWEDLNAVYRKMVYCDALFSIHPSRFYYTVPVCELCYKIYSFMDVQRELQVLHTPDFNALKKSNDIDLQHEQLTKSEWGDEIATMDKKWSKFRRPTSKNIRNSFDGSEMANSTHGLANDGATGTRAFAQRVIETHEKLLNKAKPARPTSAGNSTPQQITRTRTISSHDSRALSAFSAGRRPANSSHRVPLNHTNDSNFDDFVDRGIGSKGPLHRDIAFKNKGGSISTWVKLMTEKYNETTEQKALVRASSAVLSHRKYLDETSGGVFMTSRVDYGKMVNLRDADRFRSTEYGPTDADAQNLSREHESPVAAQQQRSVSPVGRVRPSSAVVRTSSSREAVASPPQSNLTRALSDGNYRSIEPDTIVTETVIKKKSSPGKFIVDPKRFSEVQRLPKPNISLPSPYSFSSLPYMKAPLLPQTASKKTVQIIDQKDTEQRGDSLENSVDERIIESETALSYTTSQNSLYQVNSGMEINVMAVPQDLEDYGPATAATPGESTGARTPLMAVSPFDDGVLPMPSYSDEY